MQQKPLGPMQILAPFRSDHVKNMQYRHKRLDRLVATKVPEIHYIGQIVGGSGLISSVSEGVCCRWRVEYGSTMERLGGDDQGQTQVAYARYHENEPITFNHPIDMHFAEVGLQGWGAPRICLQCFRYDEFGRRMLLGYGFANLPTTSGNYDNIEVALWRPLGTTDQELNAFFLGKVPALVSQETLYTNAWRDRCKMVTASAGMVSIQIHCVTRFLREQRIDNA